MGAVGPPAELPSPPSPPTYAGGPVLPGAGAMLLTLGEGFSHTRPRRRSREMIQQEKYRLTRLLS